MRKFDDPRTRNLANEIERQYGNLRKFSQRIEIPYSSLVSMLNNGAYTMSYGTMLKICMLLELDPIDFTPLTGSRSMGEHLLEKQIMDTFSRFNQEGKRKVMELLEINVQIEKYTVSFSRVPDGGNQEQEVAGAGIQGQAGCWGLIPI